MKFALRLAPLVEIFLLTSMVSFAQPWSGILAPNRAIDWRVAGLPSTFPDGETTPNPWTPPSRTQCVTSACQIVTNNGASSTVAQINAAIASAPAGAYVLLPAGTYTISSTLIMYGVNNVTLRGSGPMETTLALSNGVDIQMGASWGSEGSGKLTQSYAAGSTSITVGSLTGISPVAGRLAWISQCDTGSGPQPCSAAPVDNGGLFICGDYNGCQTGTTSTSVYSHQRQTVLITSVANNGDGTYTLGISPGLYMPNWTTTNGAVMGWPGAARQIIGVGLEDLTVSATNSANYNVIMQQAYASWIKGVRFIGSGANSALHLAGAKSSLVMSNYFSASAYLGSSYPYGLFMGSSSDVLILNNLSAGGLAAQFRGRNTGNVTAYNFGRDGFTLYAENTWSFDHHAFSSFNLWEGNQNAAMTEDNIWGTHALNSYFRNYSPCVDDPYVGGTPNARGIVIDNFQRFENLIGNALGSSQCTGYQGTGFGNAFQIATGDPLVASTMMRWGNVTVARQATDTPTNSGVRFVSSEVPYALSSPNTAFSNPVPSTTTLPASFFLPVSAHPMGETGLSWWKTCTVWASFPTDCASYQIQPFPTAGPDVSSGPYVNGHAHDIPAAVAWKTLPIDPIYQRSYTITSSSWSNGIETLTISGLPNVTHLMGGFQLTGVNAACRPSRGNSYTGRADGEILIVASGITTISYALPSDPGVSCTGTFLFPNVRRFDERVYQPDSTVTIAPPTVLSATVH